MNRKLRYLGLLLILPVFTVALTSTWQTIPAASALTSRTNFNDNHYTALYPGGPRICGDHICAPGEYDKMQQALAQAQIKGKGGNTTPSTPSTPPATTPSNNNETTTMPINNNATTTMPTTSVCDSVKAILTDAGESSTIIAKVMADLGCS